MAGVNTVHLIGNLGRDPEVRHLESGKTVASISLGVTESYKDRNGNKVENTEWVELELWEGLAKLAEQHLTKGKTIYVEGKLKSDTWEYEGQTRKKIKVRVQNMTMLGGNTSRPATTEAEPAIQFDENGEVKVDYDLPF